MCQTSSEVAEDMLRSPEGLVHWSYSSQILYNYLQKLFTDWQGTAQIQLIPQLHSHKFVSQPPQ